MHPGASAPGVNDGARRFAAGPRSLGRCPSIGSWLRERPSLHC